MCESQDDAVQSNDAYGGIQTDHYTLVDSGN
jgi:hypothetical protein